MIIAIAMNVSDHTALKKSYLLYVYSKIIGLKRKRHLLGAEKLKWFLLLSEIDISGKCW